MLLGENEFAAQNVIEQSTSVSTSGPTPMSYYAAAAYMATQRCIEFLAQEFKSVSSAPWLGFDGTGTLPVEIKLDTSLDTPVKWSLADQRILLNPNLSPYLGASIESMCHELGHGIFRLGLPVSFSLEDFSVEEGFGDALGASAEMYVRGYPGPAAVPLPGGGNLTWSGWCNGGDPSNTTCDRNLQFPILSDSLACHVRDGLGAEIISYCPGDYKGPYFCPFVTKCEPLNGVLNGCCDEHGNSTVLSHWFYKVAHGDDGTTAKSCPYVVKPLDSTLATSVSMASRILFQGVRDLYKNKSGFEGIADATVQAASLLYGANATETVKQAWFGVGVKEEVFLDSSVAEIEPPRDKHDVYPWITFYWPIHAAEKPLGWDFQIAEGPFAPPVFESWVTSFTTHNGKEAGYLKLALPFKSNKRYFWRTRLHSTEAWYDCYPIHSFVGTDVTVHVGDHSRSTTA